MNVGEIKDELTKMLGNTLAQTGHPFVSPVDMRYRWISRAANSIPRKAAAGGRDLLVTFEELFATWKAQTAEGVAKLNRPAGALVIREVYSFDMTGANADVDRPRLVAQLRPEVFDMGRSATESAAWPHSWTNKGEFIAIRPLPRAPYLTDVHLYGIKREAVFNNDAQTPTLREDWHEAILYEAARLGAKALGYNDRAKEYGAHVLELVSTGVEVAAQSDLYDDPTFDFDGMEQWEVYGR